MKVKTVMMSVIVGSALSMISVPHAGAGGTSPLQALVDAAAQRLETADPVAASKFRTGGQVDDPQREQQVIDAVTADATSARVDAGYVHDVFRNQIDATDSVEHSRFAQWKLDPASAPASAPDLSASRDIIDKLNHSIVGEIAKQWSALHSPSCPADLDAAVQAVAQVRNLDPVYRQALAYATHSYCR
ncbi:chorismate mutase [Mycobacterium sp. URHB0021]|jgi:chorismate mutase